MTSAEVVSALYAGAVTARDDVRWSDVGAYLGRCVVMTVLRNALDGSTL
jgi:hypothetical protein